MKTRNILPGAFVLALLVAVGLWLQNEVRIDSCLDRGGRWDEERRMCEEATAYNLSSNVRYGAGASCRDSLCLFRFRISILRRPIESKAQSGLSLMSLHCTYVGYA